MPFLRELQKSIARPSNVPQRFLHTFKTSMFTEQRRAYGKDKETATSSEDFEQFNVKKAIRRNGKKVIVEKVVSLTSRQIWKMIWKKLPIRVKMDGNVCVEIEIEDITRTAERKSERFYRKLPYFGVLDLPAMAVDEFFHPSPFCDSKLGMKTYVGERAICFALKVAWNQFAQMKSDFFSDKGDGLLGQKGEMMDFMRTATGTITKRFAAVMKSPDEMEEALTQSVFKHTGVSFATLMLIIVTRQVFQLARGSNILPQQSPVVGWYCTRNNTYAFSPNTGEMSIVHRDMHDSLAYGLQSPVSLILYNLVHNAITLEAEMNPKGPRYYAPSMERLLGLVEFMSDLYEGFMSEPPDALLFDFARPTVQKAGKLAQLNSGFSGKEPFDLLSSQIQTQQETIKSLLQELPFDSARVNYEGMQLCSLSTRSDIITTTNAARWSRILPAQGGEISSILGKIQTQNSSPAANWAKNNYSEDTKPTARQLSATVIFLLLRRIERFQSSDISKAKQRYNPELKKTIEKATKAVATNEDVGLDDESAQLHIQEESELEGSSTEEENEAEQEGGLHDPDFLDNVIDAEQNEGERLRIMSDAGPTLPKTSRLRAIPLMWVEDGAGNDVLPLDYDLNIRDILIDSQLVDYLLTIRLKPQPVDYADYFVHEAAPVSAITGGNDPKFFTETKVLSDSSLLPRSKGIEPSNDQVNVAWDLKLEGAKEVRVYEATKGFNKEVYRSEAKGKSLEETGWVGLPYPREVSQASREPIPTKSRLTAKIDTDAKAKVRTYNRSLFPLLYLTGTIGPVGSARHRRKRERHWFRTTELHRLVFPLCPDYESWSVNQKREFYFPLHSELSRFARLHPSLITSSMSEMRSHFQGASCEYTDGLIQGLLLGADTLLNIASFHLAVAMTAIEEKKAPGSQEGILNPDFALADANIDDVMSLLLPLVPEKSLGIAKIVLANQQKILRAQIDFEKTLLHTLIRGYLGQFFVSGNRLASDQRTVPSVVLSLAETAPVLPSQILKTPASGAVLLEADAQRIVVDQYIPIVTLGRILGMLSESRQSGSKCVPRAVLNEHTMKNLCAVLLAPSPVGFGTLTSSFLGIPCSDPLTSAYEYSCANPDSRLADALADYFECQSSFYEEDIWQERSGHARKIAMTLSDATWILKAMVCSHARPRPAAL